MKSFINLISGCAGLSPAAIWLVKERHELDDEKWGNNSNLAFAWLTNSSICWLIDQLGCKAGSVKHNNKMSCTFGEQK